MALAALALLSGCAATPSAEERPASQPQPQHHATRFGHVHGIVAEGEEAFLVGTHTGVYRIDKTGTVEGPLGGYDFDAMGFSELEDALIASGHPGPSTPAQFGSPHMGIIRSEDRGGSWEPVAFTGVEDFHVLTSGASGRIYGIGSTSPTVLMSDDAGATWMEGSPLEAVDLAATGDGRLYGATSEGLQVADVDAAAFQLVTEAPLLYLIEAVDSTLFGVGTDGQLWRSGSDGAWKTIGSSRGRVQALGATPSGVALVDDRGLITIESEITTTVLRFD